jgi:hypothetical protein
MLSLTGKRVNLTGQDLGQVERRPGRLCRAVALLTKTGQDLGRVFKSRLGCVFIGHELYIFYKAA